METGFIFSADIHGNKIHIKKLFRFALKNKISNIILGGDICPKDSLHRTIKDQKRFLQFLIKFINEYKKKIKKFNVYLILGNDDFIANEPYLKKSQGIYYIHLKKIKLCKYHLFGFSYVAPTPFKFKDWELWDTANINDDVLRGEFVTQGIKFKNGRYLDFDLNDIPRKSNIYSLLNKEIKDIDFSKTIFIIHTPPFNTKIDICKTKEHVGSIGVRKIIEEKQPLLTLHGHIHESCKISSVYYDKIGKTIVINACNDYLSDKVSLILVNIKDKKVKHKRIII